MLPPPRLQPFIFTERDCGACYGRVMLSATRTVHIAIDKQPDGDEDKDDEAPRLLKEDEEEDDEEKAPRLPRALVAGLARVSHQKWLVEDMLVPAPGWRLSSAVMVVCRRACAPSGCCALRVFEVHTSSHQPPHHRRWFLQ